MVEQAAAAFGFTPRVQFDGPLDTAAQPGLVDDVQAVVREALTNAAKYAHATDVEVMITTDVTNLVVTVLDNGAGMANAKRRSGIANLRTRAEQASRQPGHQAANRGRHRTPLERAGQLATQFTVPMGLTFGPRCRHQLLC